MSISANLYVMTRAAEKAAIGIIRDFGELEKLQVSKKGFKNFVTSADRNAESKIISSLSRARSEFSFICEESGIINNENRTSTWIVDPVDGTANFMRGIPYFAINIALMENDKIVAGLTLDPLRNDCYMAESGCGAFIGERNRIRVSGRENIAESIIATNIVNDEKLGKLGAIIRRTGSVALDLAYLSAGKYDVVIERNVQLWDIASGIILVKEAGGFVNYKKMSDDKFDIIAASSENIINRINLFD